MDDGIDGHALELLGISVVLDIKQSSCAKELALIRARATCIKSAYEAYDHEQ